MYSIGQKLKYKDGKGYITIQDIRQHSNGFGSMGVYRVKWSDSDKNTGSTWYSRAIIYNCFVFMKLTNYKARRKYEI